MPTFSSAEALKKEILKRSKVAVEIAEKKAHQIIHQFLRQYYGEFAPEEYIRIYKLLSSLVKTEVRSTGNGWEAEVYFDASRLNYENGVMPLQHTPEHGMYGWATWGAEEVLDTAMHGSHGGYIGGTAIWDQSMAVLNSSMITILKNSLIKAGVPVK